MTMISDFSIILLSFPQYPNGICLPILVVEDFSGLFAHPSIFLFKDSMAA